MKSQLRFANGSRLNRVMLAKVCSAAVNGIEAYPIEVEVNAGWGDTLVVIVVNKTPNLDFNISRALPAFI
jgi:hypothetical protein